MNEHEFRSAVKSAKIAAGLCVCSLAVLMLVLLIDNQIKRRLMADVAQARQIVDTFTVNARSYANGTTRPDDNGAADQRGGNTADDVGGDPAAGQDVDQAGDSPAFPPRARGAGNAGGPRGNVG